MPILSEKTHVVGRTEDFNAPYFDLSFCINSSSLIIFFSSRMSTVSSFSWLNCVKKLISCWRSDVDVGFFAGNRFL